MKRYFLACSHTERYATVCAGQCEWVSVCIEFSISIHERHERFNKQKSIACIFIVILAAAVVVFVVVVVATTSSCAIEPVIAFQNVKIEMFVYIIRIFGLRPLSLSVPHFAFQFFRFQSSYSKICRYSRGVRWQVLGNVVRVRMLFCWRKKTRMWCNVQCFVSCDSKIHALQTTVNFGGEQTTRNVDKLRTVYQNRQKCVQVLSELNSVLFAVCVCACVSQSTNKMCLPPAYSQQRSRAPNSPMSRNYIHTFSNKSHIEFMIF